MSPEHILDISKTIIQQIDVADKRQFEYAIQQAQAEQTGKKHAILWGAIIALVGFAATVYLATHGHEMIALSVSLPLATIIAVIVGNRFLD